MASLEKMNNKVILGLIGLLFLVIESGGFVAHRVSTQRDIEILPHSIVSEAAQEIHGTKVAVEDLVKRVDHLEGLVEDDLRQAYQERRNLFERVAGIEAVLRLRE